MRKLVCLFFIPQAMLLGILISGAGAQALNPGYGPASWNPAQSLVEISITQHEQYRLFDGMGMAILDVGKDYVRALATSEQLARVRAMGFTVEILLKDYTKEFEERGYPPMGVPALTGTQGWNFYHTYNQVRDSLRALTLRHPTICRVESLGPSVQNRVLWGIRISDNVGVRENEPRFRITGNIHGNEHIGCEVSLYMAYMLADSYGVSSRLTQVVNDFVVFIVPMQNPDGATANTRENPNGVDLNRDYGYMWDGWGGSHGLFSQPEIRHLQRNGEANPYTLSLAYHSGAELVVYPWSYTNLRTQDDLMFKRLAYGYHAYSRYDTINSYRWYQIHGCSSDEAYGAHGNMELIIEVWVRGGYNPPPESIEAVCLRNKEGMIYYLNKSRTGIHGTLTDLTNGRPVQALIRPYPLSQSRDWFLYSSRENGDYHRPLLSGIYNLKLSANGYRDTVVANIVVPDTVNPVVRNIQMTPGNNYAAYRVVAVWQDDGFGLTNTTLTPWVLGIPENKAYAMGPSGRIILDMGQGTEIVDGTGPDLRVTEYPNASHAVQCSVSNSWTGPWTSLGGGNGTTNFDFAGRISLARYVLLRTGASGYSLDAVEALNHASGVVAGSAFSTPHEFRLRVFPNPFTSFAIVPGYAREVFSLYDISGRKVGIYKGSRIGEGLSPGVYFLKPADREGPPLRIVKVR